MATTSTSSVTDTKTIKIVKMKGSTYMWCTIYADDVKVCNIFGEHSEERLPNIILEEETLLTPL